MIEAGRLYSKGPQIVSKTLEPSISYSFIPYRYPALFNTPSNQACASGDSAGVGSLW